MIKSIEIRTIDREGVTFDILNIFKLEKINIVKLEVKTHFVYLRYTVNSETQQNQILTRLQQLAEVKQISTAEWLPSEIQEQEMISVYNDLEEMIAITDTQGLLLFSNQSFQTIFKNTHNSIFRIIPISKRKVLNIESTEQIHFQFTDARLKRYIAHIRLMKSIEGKKYIWMIHSLQKMQEKMIQSHATELLSLDDILHQSKVMHDIIQTAKQIAKSNSNVLIRGESGTGKELIARALHKDGLRGFGPFLAINCAAIPDSLLESEIFGYEAGAFTGSNPNGKIGLLEQADQGTLFLDEIGDLSLHLQSKLLRVIEDKKSRRIGSNQEVKLDVRIISATHQSLEEMIEKKLFRLDLYYRLNTYSIHLPPLRYRSEDISLLATYFLKRESKKLGRSIRFKQEALEKLRRHNWPGNIRELENCVERSVALCQQEDLFESDIILDLRQSLLSENNYEQNYHDFIQQQERDFWGYWNRKNLSSRQLAKLHDISHSSAANKLKLFTKRTFEN